MWRRSDRPSFNEAGGFLPRRISAALQVPFTSLPASMRPEDFSPGGMADLSRELSGYVLLQ